MARHGESDLQIACVRWFNYEYPQYQKLLFSVPNGGRRSVITAKVLKAEGVVSGVSDLILMVPMYPFHALCIEMKYGKGKQTPKQKEWESLVTHFNYKYEVVYSFEEFTSLINLYLSNAQRRF